MLSVANWLIHLLKLVTGLYLLTLSNQLLVCQASALSCYEFTDKAVTGLI